MGCKPSFTSSFYLRDPKISHERKTNKGFRPKGKRTGFKWDAINMPETSTWTIRRGEGQDRM